MKKVRVILSPEAKEVYEFLNREAPDSKFERTILNALSKKILATLAFTWSNNLTDYIQQENIPSQK